MKNIITSTVVIKKLFLLVLVFLSACSASQQAIPSTESTQAVFQTEAARFPHLCPNDTPHYLEKTESISPDGLWLGELCYSSEYKDLVLTFSNKKTHVIWKMFYHDYIPDVAFDDGGMRVAHWSNDSRYVYFHTWLSTSVGECFYEGYDTGVGLFRLNLQTGQTKEILPIKDDSVWYGFSFSSSDRWLVYGIRTIDLVIFDFKTGGSISVAHEKEFTQGGGYIWSPDGLRFVYSTVKYLPEHIGTESYTLRLVDAQTGAERILLESKTSCYLVNKWEDSDVLLVEYYDEIFNRAVMKYDLNSNSIISESTATSP